MTTTNNMNTSDDVKKNKFTLSRSAMRTAVVAKNPMRRRFMSQQKRTQGSLIDQALEIVNSPLGSTTISSSNASVTGRRGSSSLLMGRTRRGSCLLQSRRGSGLCERRASELLMDNTDRLSTLVLSSGIDIDFDESDDDDSDLDV